VIEIADPAEMRAWSRRARAAGRRIGLVPTMGYLHEGHLRLVDRSRARSDRTVLSAFVNPLQFGPGEDFDRYPRDPERDRAMARERGVDCYFAPAVSALYPVPPAIRFSADPLIRHLCGPGRPGHFEGVLLVVAKLFHLVEPDVAVFGRKDAQQAVLIKRMVEDLNFALDIEVAPIVREADGLALSSRNVYLEPAERRAAVALSRGLECAHVGFRRGTSDAAALTELVRETIGRESLVTLEYAEAVDPRTLQPVRTASADTLLAVAARVGRARLIDNVILGQGLGADERLSPAGAAR
jgi:pantoate--beta-alanine ligase